MVDVNEWCEFLLLRISGVNDWCEAWVWIGRVDGWYEWVVWMSSVNLQFTVNGPQTRGVRCESHGDHSHLIFTPFKHTCARTHTYTHIYTYCRVFRVFVCDAWNTCIPYVLHMCMCMYSVSGLALMEYGIVVRISCVFHVFHVYCDAVWNTCAIH